MNKLLNIRIAFESLQLNRFRSSLAILGVVIGVAGVVAVVSIGEANRRRIELEVERIGADVFWLQPNFQRFMAMAPLRQKSKPVSALQEMPLFQESDLRSIVTFCPEVRAAAPVKRFGAAGVFRGQEYQLDCFATAPAYERVRKLKLLAGRFLHAIDDSIRNRIGVLKYSTELKSLLACGNVLGERIWVNDVAFTVVGVVESRTDFNGASSGLTLYLPISTLPYLSLETDGYELIYCQAPDRSALETTMQHVIGVLRTRHEGRNWFETVTARDLFRSAENLTRTATLVTAGIAGIALIVGGIGIMNIMLVAVTERTREIGLRRTVGARQRDIATQFLVEAITLCLAGGQIGVIIGILAARVVSRSLQIETAFSVAPALVGIGFSIAVGILSGFFPAYKASRLSPVDALRYE
jgi:putative ABC transport system permease protein